jgi:hypothetical protein
LPLALLEVSETLPPAQKVVGPPGVIVGVAGIGLIVISAELDEMHPDGVVTINVSVTLPDAPAVYVTLWADVDDVIVPLVMPHA